jgi:hypothetical protein
VRRCQCAVLTLTVRSSRADKTLVMLSLLAMGIEDASLREFVRHFVSTTLVRGKSWIEFGVICH